MTLHLTIITIRVNSCDVIVYWSNENVKLSKFVYSRRKKKHILYPQIQNFESPTKTGIATSFLCLYPQQDGNISNVTSTTDQLNHSNSEWLLDHFKKAGFQVVLPRHGVFIQKEEFKWPNLADLLKEVNYCNIQCVIFKSHLHWFFTINIRPVTSSKKRKC